MRIPNYDLASGENNYKQLQNYMPSDTFRMLMCGPSGCGKTNTLMHMLYNLLYFDKIYLFSKNLQQPKYTMSTPVGCLISGRAITVRPCFDHSTIGNFSRLAQDWRRTKQTDGNTIWVLALTGPSFRSVLLERKRKVVNAKKVKRRAETWLTAIMQISNHALNLNLTCQQMWHLWLCPFRED